MRLKKNAIQTLTNSHASLKTFMIDIDIQKRSLLLTHAKIFLFYEWNEFLNNMNQFHNCLFEWKIRTIQLKLTLLFGCVT